MQRSKFRASMTISYTHVIGIFSFRTYHDLLEIQSSVRRIVGSTCLLRPRTYHDLLEIQSSVRRGRAFIVTFCFRAYHDLLEIQSSVRRSRTYTYRLFFFCSRPFGDLLRDTTSVRRGKHLLGNMIDTHTHISGRRGLLRCRLWGVVREWSLVRFPPCGYVKGRECRGRRAGRVRERWCEWGRGGRGVEGAR